MIKLQLKELKTQKKRGQVIEMKKDEHWRMRNEVIDSEKKGGLEVNRERKLKLNKRD